MATEPPEIPPTESLIAPEKPVPAKRGRPRKTAALASVTTTTLTRTTRQIARPRTVARIKPPSAESHTTLLNRLVNFSVIAAVFVTALAIQRIVPTESVTTPRVESLPTTASAPATSSILVPATPAAATPTPTAAAVSSPTPAATVPVAQNTAAPSPASAAEIPTPAATSETATPLAQQVLKSATKVAKKMRPAKLADHSTPLNAGGAEDLDSESARQSYLTKSKLATRTATPGK